MKALTLRLDDKIWRKVSLMAIRRGTYRSQIIRWAINKYLQEVCGKIK